MAAIRHIDLTDPKTAASANAPPRVFDFSRSDYVFPDFMRDRTRYDAAQAYWGIVFTRAMDAAPVAEGETEWKRHWRYNPLRNGDNIFSAICRCRNLAVRINQRPPTVSQSGEFAWAVEQIKWGRRDIVQELVVTCVPGRNAMKRVFPLLISWLRGDTLPQEFEAKYDV